MATNTGVLPPIFVASLWAPTLVDYIEWTLDTVSIQKSNHTVNKTRFDSSILSFNISNSVGQMPNARWKLSFNVC